MISSLGNSPIPTYSQLGVWNRKVEIKTTAPPDSRFGSVWVLYGVEMGLVTSLSNKSLISQHS